MKWRLAYSVRRGASGALFAPPQVLIGQTYERRAAFDCGASQNDSAAGRPSVTAASERKAVLAPKILKTRWTQFRVSNSVLNVFVAQVGL